MTDKSLILKVEKHVLYYIVADNLIILHTHFVWKVPH